MMDIALAFTIVCAAPGPANMALAARAMAQGQGAATSMAFGLALGLGVWGIAAATGLGALLAASGTALSLLKLLGAGYLLWLAVSSARAALHPAVEEQTVAAPGRGFRAGVIVNLSNPKAVLAWLAALSMGLSPDAGAGAVFAATALCAFIGLLNYLFWGFAFSRPAAMTLYRRARRRIEAGCALFFSLAAVGLLRSALVR